MWTVFGTSVTQSWMFWLVFLLEITWISIQRFLELLSHFFPRENSTLKPTQWFQHLHHFWIGLLRTECENWNLTIQNIGFRWSWIYHDLAMKVSLGEMNGNLTHIENQESRGFSSWFKLFDSEVLPKIKWIFQLPLTWNMASWRAWKCAI